MIHLLMGVFDVLKSIVKDAINFETFFKINLVIYLIYLSYHSLKLLSKKHHRL